MRPKVLVTDISSYKAIVFCRALADCCEVWSGDWRPLTKTLRTRFAGQHFLYPSPKRDPQGFVEVLAERVKQMGIDRLIPINSSEIRLCLEHRHRFGSALDGFGECEDFLRLDDKRRLSELTRALAVRTPRTYSLASLGPGEVEFPLVFKPTQSSSALGVIYIQNQEELNRLKSDQRGRRESDYVLQEFISGVGVGYSVLAKRGEIVASYGHKRLAEWPVSGGSSTARASFFHPGMQATAELIVKNTNWTGLAMFEFKWTEQNEVVLIEVNPRVWGSIFQAVASGVNFPRLWVCGDGDPMRATSAKEVITYLPLLHWMSCLFYLIKQNKFGPLWHRLRHFSCYRPDVSFFTDPLGFLSLFSRLG